MKWFFPGILIMSLCIFGCNDENRQEIIRSASAFDLAQATASVKQSNLGLMNAFEERDTAGILKCFIKQAQLMTTGRATIKGQDSIRQYVNRLFRYDIKELKLDSKNLWGDSLLLTELGSYEVTNSKNKKADAGKYITLWKRESGNWKIFVTMWASDSPDRALFFSDEELTTPPNQKTKDKHEK